jgi:hypothetical protein
MLTVPFQVNKAEFSIFAVLESQNLERIKSYDPAQIHIRRLGETWQKLKLREIIISYATDAELQRLVQVTTREELLVALRHLSRGFQFLPDAGDQNEVVYQNEAIYQGAATP